MDDAFFASDPQALRLGFQAVCEHDKLSLAEILFANMPLPIQKEQLQGDNASLLRRVLSRRKHAIEQWLWGQAQVLLS